MSESKAEIDVAGIDVGKRALDVSVDEGKARRFANTAAGVGELVSWLRSQGAALAVCEASGGYEGLVVDGLRQGGVPVHIAHPNQVRAFARACGYQAKTDGLDARVLSRNGRVFQPAPTLAQEADRGQLQDLLRRREQLVGQRTQEKNRLSRVRNPGTQDSIRRHIAWLDQEIGMLDDQYQELLGPWSFGDWLSCIAACRAWVCRPPRRWSPGCPSWAGATARHWPPCVA